MENNIPTAWEFITDCPGHLTGEVDDETLMIEFAKIHVEAALESRDRLYQTHYPEINWTEDNIKFIKDSYPLSNIK